MLKLLAVAVIAAVIAFAAGPASAVTDLWALDDQGEPAKLKGFTNKERIFSIEEHATLNEAMKKKFAHRVVYCNQEFMISTAQKRWILTHTKVKHRIVLRERLPKGKFHNVC